MMSSVCTLRLKRRKALSMDSPSCSRTSANDSPPYCVEYPTLLHLATRNHFLSAIYRAQMGACGASSDHVSKKVVFLSHFDWNRRELDLRIHCWNVRGR